MEVVSEVAPIGHTYTEFGFCKYLVSLAALPGLANPDRKLAMRDDLGGGIGGGPDRPYIYGVCFLQEFGKFGDSSREGQSR